MAYVPPHLRNKSSSKPPSPSAPSPTVPTSPHETLYKADDIHYHFWPTYYTTRREISLNAQDQADSRQQFAKIREERGWTSHNPSTLNATEQEPGKLGYVLLFPGANPRWESDGVIFAKSNLECLPLAGPEWKADGYNGDEKAGEGEGGMDGEAGAGTEEQNEERDSNAQSDKNDGSDEGLTGGAVQPLTQSSASTPANPLTDPIPSFQQTHRGPGRTIKFIGYYHLTRVEHLAPRSPKLVRMLEQKWMKKDKYGKVRPIEREQKGWQESLSHRWAVLKFEKVDKEGLEEPKIRLLEEGELGEEGTWHVKKETTKGKSVSEMLAELRMGDTAKDKEKGEMKAEGNGKENDAKAAG